MTDAQAHMAHIDYDQRELPLHMVTSDDGTRIAYEQSGYGPPVVIVGGGLNEKAMHADLAVRLSTQFTVYNYDRRARGSSDDRLEGPYDLQREVEDLAAVISAVGEPCHVFANCTGAMIAIPAAAGGVPLASLAVYEPPYDGPKVSQEFKDELSSLLAEDRRTEAVALWLEIDALFTRDEVIYFQSHPIWPAFEAMAHSMPYDTQLSDWAKQVPKEQLAHIHIPFLVLAGDETRGWMLDTCRALADAAPDGRFVSMPSAGHLMDDALGAELLTSFFAHAVSK